MDLEGPGSASLQALLRVLKAQGHTLVSPADRLNLHPLAVPLTRVSAPSGSAHAAVTATATASAFRPWRPHAAVVCVAARSRIRAVRTAAHGRCSISLADACFPLNVLFFIRVQRISSRAQLTLILRQTRIYRYMTRMRFCMHNVPAEHTRSKAGTCLLPITFFAYKAHI